MQSFPFNRFPSHEDDDAVNATMALTALMVPSPLSLSVALPIGSAIYHHHFVERLTAIAHFFV